MSLSRSNRLKKNHIINNIKSLTFKIKKYLQLLLFFFNKNSLKNY